MIFQKDSSRIWKLIISGILFLLVAIPVSIHSSFVYFIDVIIGSYVQMDENAFFHTLYTIISFICSPEMCLLWTAIIAILLWRFHFKILALWSICLVFGGDVIGEIIKHIIRRPRPISHPASIKGFSFPSVHTLSIFLVASIIWLIASLIIKKIKWRYIIKALCIIVVILVMLARIYLSAHYFTDTFGALLVGYAWLQISKYLSSLYITFNE